MSASQKPITDNLQFYFEWSMFWVSRISITIHILVYFILRCYWKWNVFRWLHTHSAMEIKWKSTGTAVLTQVSNDYFIDWRLYQIVSRSCSLLSRTENFIFGANLLAKKQIICLNKTVTFPSISVNVFTQTMSVR